MNIGSCIIIYLITLKTPNRYKEFQNTDIREYMFRLCGEKSIYDCMRQCDIS